MGMCTLGSANRASDKCGCAKPSAIDMSYLEPRADNFKITNLSEIGNFLVAVITYPNCLPYNGAKVLVYEGVTIKDITSWELIDPHFLENENFISPIARFPASIGGIEDAVNYTRMLCDDFEE